VVVLTILAQTKNSFRFQGRSFLAFVICPTAPIEHWLADLDDWVAKTPDFFASKPLIVDFSQVSIKRDEFSSLLARFQSGRFRLISIEGIDPSWLPSDLAPLPGGRHRQEIEHEIKAAKSRSATNISKSPSDESEVNSLMLTSPVRSGQAIFFPEGDVSVTGSVASGAEIIAGGSIHIYGALRGRAIAGSTGSLDARIFCAKFEAELVVIGGFYKSAQDIDPQMFGKSVQIWLQDNLILLKVME